MKVGRFVLCAGWLVSGAALTGCGPALGPCVPVQGKVTLGVNPLVGGTISFIPLEDEAGRPRPEGAVDHQGRYALRTAGREGAPLGKYRAIVTTSGEDKAQDNQFDSRYSHPQQSPLVLEVTEDAPEGTYDLQLVPLRRH